MYIMRLFYNKIGLIMINSNKKILLACLLSASFSSFAGTYNSDIDYYEDEGKLLFKVRAHGIKSETKLSKLPTPTSATPLKIDNLSRNGYGGDAAIAIFISPNFATELSLGLDMYNVKKSAIATIANNYNGNSLLAKGKKRMYVLPFSAALQYHAAPYGAIRPYVGAGCQAAYNFNKIKMLKIRSSYGPLIQVGADFVAKDDTLINVDFRQYFLKPKVDFRQALTGDSIVSSRLKMRPLVLSIGVGFIL